jgi:hypothetical protein
MRSATEVRTTHLVTCWQCGNEFDLLEATWCGCGVSLDRPSKTCPHCLQCTCLHPDYNNDLFWGSAPRYLNRSGFDKLFYLYL